MTIAESTIVDLIVWLIFRSKVKEACQSYYCGFETTGWYYINVVALVLMIVLSVAIFLNKMQMETNMIDIFSNASVNVNNGAQTSAASSASGTSQATPMDAKAIMEKAKTMPKNAKIGGAVGVVALLVVIIFAYKSSRTIDLDKYTTREVGPFILERMMFISLS